MRRPLPLLAVCFGAGVAIGLTAWLPFLHDRTLLLCGIFLWFLALVLGLGHQHGVGQWVALALVFALGFLSARLPRGATSLSAIVPLEAGAKASATISGRVAQVPDSHTNVPMRILLQAQEVEIDDCVQPAHESIPVLIYGRYDWPPKQWEHWSFEGKLCYTPDDYGGEWLFITGVNRSGQLGPPAATLTVWSQQLRKQAAQILQAGIEDRPDRYGVIHALLLGYRAMLPDEILQAFRSTGTMHVFAISGLHVGILCAVLVFVIGLLRVPRTCRVLVLAPMILFYALMTGARASAIRAGLMAITYLAAPFFGRRADAWSALAVAAIVILAWQPDQLHDLGFIFSFTAVAGILSIVPLAEAWLQRHLPIDPFLEKGAGPGVLPTILLWFGRMAVVSIAAWLSTTPLSLYYFGRFAPIALVANLIVLPLAFLIVVSGCLALLAASIGGASFAVVFNLANFAYVGLLVQGMKLLEQVPFGHAENIKITLVPVVVWYCVLLCTVFYLRRRCK